MEKLRKWRRFKGKRRRLKAKWLEYSGKEWEKAKERDRGRLQRM